MVKKVKKTVKKAKKAAEKKPALNIKIESDGGDECVDVFKNRVRTNMCNLCRWRFPTFAVVLLAVGLVWLLTELGVITATIPWWPLILILIALGFIINRFANR